MITYRFFRHYVDMVEGSVNAAVMLSFATGKQVNLKMDEGLDGFGYWKFTRDDWFKATGLSRDQQETCRSILRRTEFWHEKLTGLPAVMRYRVDLDALSDAEKEVK